MAVVPLEALRTLQRLIGRLNTGPDLPSTLQAVVDGVVEGLDFGVAVVNVVHDDRNVEVVAVSGPPDVSDTLLGNRVELSCWEDMLDRAEDWGPLRYLPHTLADLDDIVSWVPDVDASDDPESWHPLDSLFAPLYSVNGDLVGVLSVDLPVSGMRPDPTQCELLGMYAVQAGIAIDNARLAERLRASENSFRMAFDNAPVGMSLVDFHPDSLGRFLRCNEAICRMLGYSRHDLEQRSVFDVTHPDDGEADDALIAAVLDGARDHYRVEKRYLHADGRVLWVSLNTSVVRDAHGTALYGITQFEDISDRRAEHAELSRRARQDPLTGVLNRSALRAAVDQAIAAARDRRQPGVLLFCDLDDFKLVNDRYGHAVGDQVLVTVSRRLRAQLRSSDVIVRFGGDEFLVIAEEACPELACDLVDRLREAVAAPMNAEGHRITLTVTVGRACITGEPGQTTDSLVDEADRDMYRHKPVRFPAVP